MKPELGFSVSEGEGISLSKKIKSLPSQINYVQLMFVELPSKQTTKSVIDALSKKNLKSVLHAPYSINLARSLDTSLGKKSAVTLIESVLLARELGSEYVVFHVGKSLKMDESDALKNFIEGVRFVIQTAGVDVSIFPKLLLESSSGQGSEMFVSLGDLFSVVSRIDPSHSNLGVCVDTCHSFAAGYRLAEIAVAIETNRDVVNLIHLNDSKGSRGSRIDRHSSIGKGLAFSTEEGAEPFHSIVKFATDNSIPMIFETPIDGLTNDIQTVYHSLSLETHPEFSEPSPSTDEKAPLINRKIARILFDLSRQTTDKYKKAAFMKAASIVSKLKTPIKYREDALRLSGIGSGIADRIEEILKTGSLKEIEDEEEKIKLKIVLEKIPGITSTLASMLIDTFRVKSISDLRLHRSSLPAITIKSLPYADSITQRIPRKIIDKYSSIFSKLFPSDVHFKIAGSYLRGKKTSGDIDVLITKDGVKTANEAKSSSTISDIVKLISANLKVDLIISSGSEKAMIIMTIPDDIPRRVDFVLAPQDEYETYLLYFTGSKEFNIEMRKRAISLGMKLSQHGLYKDGVRFPTKTEKDVFDRLGIVYVDPSDR